MNRVTKMIVILGIISCLPLLSTPAQATVQFDFASDLQGWKAEDWGYGLPTLERVEWSKTGYTGSLEADTSTMNIGSEPGNNWGKAFLNGDFSTAQDLTSEPIYTLDVYMPSNIYSPEAQLVVRSGNGWALVESGVWESLTNEAWNTISWNISSISDLDDVRQLGIQVQGWMPPTPGGSAKFNIDNVETTAIPEPASLLLLGTGLVGLLGFATRRKKV